MNQLLQQPFFQVSLPLIVTLTIAAWLQNGAITGVNKRLSDMRDEFNRRLDEVIKRLDRIETKLDDHDTRITRVEERTSPIGRR